MKTMLFVLMFLVMGCNRQVSIAASQVIPDISVSLLQMPAPTLGDKRYHTYEESLTFDKIEKISDLIKMMYPEEIDFPGHPYNVHAAADSVAYWIRKHEPHSVAELDIDYVNVRDAEKDFQSAYGKSTCVYGDITYFEHDKKDTFYFSGNIKMENGDKITFATSHYNGEGIYKTRGVRFCGVVMGQRQEVKCNLKEVVVAGWFE